jgi:hypothetical protein
MNPSSVASPMGKMGNKVPSGYKVGQIQNFTPEQMQLFQQMFSHVSPDSYLSRLAGGEQGFFNEMEAPALRQFNQLQGNIASRFSGMGLGARRSSGFQNASTQAASDFAQDLQSRRQALQQQAIKELMGLGSDLLGQRPYEQFLLPKNDFGSQFGGALGAAIPGAISGFLTGGPGGALVGGLGAGFGKYLSGGS